jgi:8-oxo-dGTP pyrophosphatase MutT (NUDIX family)
MSSTPTSFNLDGFSPAVPVRLTADITQEQLLAFRPFNNWLSTLKSSLSRQKSSAHLSDTSPYALRSITIQSVDWFGPRVGFIKLSAEVRNERNQFLPGIVFLRGGSVAVLMILRPNDSDTERWAIMVEQPRIPAGSLSFREIPAGMLDGDNTFAGTAAREIKEETGFEIKQNELVDLTVLALEGTKVTESLQNGMYPSPGGSDEFVGIFLWEKVLHRMEIEDLKDKLSGLRGQGEMNSLRLVDYEELWRFASRDSKTMTACYLYERLRRIGHKDLVDSRPWPW